nr:precorrin-8X methylmutase [uncultured Oscillibacter sp.]
MSREHTRPADIERTSMAIIGRELDARGVALPPETAAVVKRVIHTTADFDYVENLRFTPDAVALGARAMDRGVIVTDTNMALAGLSRPALARLGGEARCFMAESFIAEAARQRGTTRAAVSMEWALERHPDAVLAVGNAPTALLRIAELLAEGKRPALVIGVPVGFVNVVESKERLLEACLQYHVPAIVAMGRKGGSNVAAAVCNALLYTAADMLDPGDRGWQ